MDKNVTNENAVGTELPTSEDGQPVRPLDDLHAQTGAPMFSRPVGDRLLTGPIQVAQVREVHGN